MRRSSLIVCMGVVCALLALPTAAGAARPAAAAPQVTVNGTVVETAGPADRRGDGPGGDSEQRRLCDRSDGHDGRQRHMVIRWQEGQLSLRFQAPGGDSVTAYAAYDSNGTYTLTTALQCYGNIAGIVSDSATGLPIGGATVEFFAALPGGGWAGTPIATLIAPDGAYTSPQLPTGAYAVRAAAAGYTTAYFGGSAPTPVAVSRAVTTSAITVPLALPVAQFGSISGRVVSAASETPMSGAYVYLYKQNPDGTWPPTSPGWGNPTMTVNTDTLGTYTSGDIPLGNWRVRFFTMHTGSQWWQYVATVDLATPVTLATPGQAVTGIDGWFNKP